MVSLAAARRMAMALPEAVEQDHHGWPSFRVRQKIFATQPDGDHLHVFVDADATAEAVAEAPDACEELWWGRKLNGVRVTLGAISPELLAELLEDSWRRRAPKKLIAELEADRDEEA